MVFLLDSFDEIPDVLAATGVNDAMKDYSRAINAFAGMVEGCRSSSRPASSNAPDLDRWAVFRIAPPPRTAAANSSSTRGSARPANRQCCKDWRGVPRDGQSVTNPFFLSLLCEHVIARRRSPSDLMT